VLGALGGLDGGGLAGLGSYGDYGDDGQIYVSYVVDHVDGSWNDGEFWNVLDATRPALQSCYGDLGAKPMAISYVAAFEVTAGKVSVHTLERTWSEDGQPHDDVDGCVKKSLEGAAFSADLTGKYSYRIDLY
jgi:hypothetical protein